MSSETPQSEALESLRTVRKQEKKLRLVDMEEKTGLSIGYLSMIENGLRPSPRAAGLITEALGKKPSDFWEGM